MKEAIIHLDTIIQKVADSELKQELTLAVIDILALIGRSEIQEMINRQEGNLKESSS